MNGAGLGDHYIHIKVKAPTKLTPDQEAHMKSFAEEEHDTPGTVKGVDKNFFVPISSSATILAMSSIPG